MKYVVIDNKMPVLFGVDGNHTDVEQMNLGKITSAGFVLLEYTNGAIRAKTYGRSSSLNIGPSPGDSDLLCRHLMTEDPNKISKA